MEEIEKYLDSKYFPLGFVSLTSQKFPCDILRKYAVERIE